MLQWGLTWKDQTTEPQPNTGGIASGQSAGRGWKGMSMTTNHRTKAREEAEAMLTGDVRYAITTDSEIKPGVVVIGLAVRGAGSCLMAVPAGEYDGRVVLAALDRCNSEN